MSARKPIRPITFTGIEPEPPFATIVFAGFEDLTAVQPDHDCDLRIPAFADERNPWVWNCGLPKA